MADDDKTPDVDDPKPPDPAPDTADPKPDEDEPKGKDGQPFDADRAQRTIETLRAEARDGKKAAKERDAALARLKEIEDAEKTELEKEQQRAAQLEQQVANAAVRERETNLKLAVFEKAGDLGIASPTLALRALDRDDIEFDDSGQPTNLDDALTELLEREPLLKGQPPKPGTKRIDGGAGTGGGSEPKLTAEQLEAAQKLGMTAEEYEKFSGDGPFTEADYRRLTRKGETPAAA